MLVVRKCITACTFGVEQINMTVFHADDKVHVKQRLTIFIVGIVFYGIVLFAIVSILVPPIYILFVYPLGTDEIATKLSSVRALNQAKEKGQDLVTICSACHHVIKRVNDDMKNVEDIRTRANNYMQLDEPYEGETTVLHYLEVLRDKVGFDKLKEKVVNPLTGKKIGAYYGCLLLRPGKIMAFDDPENPTIMEDFIRALGAEPVIYPYRNECCGGYISLKEKDMSQNMCQKIEDSAKGFGADMLITACPLCKYNLNKNASSELPVYYFTELLAEALGVKEEVAK